MCTLASILFTSCPCHLTRITPCPSFRVKEEHAINDIPDFRECEHYKIVEEEDGGTCEMGPWGGCLYAAIQHVPRRKGDGLGRWGPDDFEGIGERGRREGEGEIRRQIEILLRREEMVREREGRGEVGWRGERERVYMPAGNYERSDNWGFVGVVREVAEVLDYGDVEEEEERERLEMPGGNYNYE